MDTDRGQFRRAVYAVVSRIPRGRVLSYGAVAAVLGRPRAARAVGSVLGALDAGTDVPWWRVVGADGRITTSRLGHAAQLQQALLVDEGVDVEGGRIDLERFAWTPPESWERPALSTSSGREGAAS